MYKVMFVIEGASFTWYFPDEASVADFLKDVAAPYGWDCTIKDGER